MRKIRGSPCPSVDGGNPAIQLRLLVYHIIYRVLAPSQVVGLGISSINSWESLESPHGITGIHHFEVASIYALAKVPVVNDRVSTAGSWEPRNEKWRKPQIEMRVSKKLLFLDWEMPKRKITLQTEMPYSTSFGYVWYFCQILHMCWGCCPCMCDTSDHQESG